jgi:hypothetical protein
VGPLVERLGGVDPLEALQPVQRSVQHPGQRLGRLGLAHPRFALEQQRLGQPDGEEQRGRQSGVGQVVDVVEGRGQGLDVRDVRLDVGVGALPRSP